MFSFTDQLGNTLLLEGRPKRIISLVPSQSELLWDLGLKNELIGITKFCVHPDNMFRTVERIGGTKNLDIEKIRRLGPDLIIGNKEENDRQQIELLQEEFKVWMSDINTFDDTFKMIESFGDMFQVRDQASQMAGEVRLSLESVKQIFSGNKVLYFIWKDPWLVAASQTFIHHVLVHLGFENAAAHLERYPEITAEDIKKLNPDFCFLSSEPFPFKEEHVKEIRDQVPNASGILVDGEIFSWYGSRLLHMAPYMLKLKEKLIRRG